MATERPNKNPYSNFNFIVEIDGTVIAAFSEVSGLDSENTPIEYREGADATNALRKLPGVEKYANVTLKRGISGSTALWDWRKEVRDGGSTFPPVRNVVIKLLNEKHEAGAPAMTFKLTNAWPTKLTGPSLTAKGNEIAVEQLDLAHERLDIS
jgi:phage tail-like protein